MGRLWRPGITRGSLFSGEVIAMRQIALFAVAIVLGGVGLVVHLSPGAGSEPLAFKNYVLGVTRLSEMEQIDSRVKCSKWAGVIPEDECYLAPGTIGDVEAKEVRFSFYDEKLERILIRLDHAQFEKVVLALKDKYGPPTAEKSLTREWRKDATIQGKEYTWKRIDGDITAKDFNPRLDESTVSYRTSRAIEEDQKQQKPQTKKGSGGL
jgi:hypothetical protein